MAILWPNANRQTQCQSYQDASPGQGWPSMTLTAISVKNDCLVTNFHYLWNDWHYYICFKHKSTFYAKWVCYGHFSTSYILPTLFFIFDPLLWEWCEWEISTISIKFGPTGNGFAFGAIPHRAGYLLYKMNMFQALSNNLYVANFFGLLSHYHESKSSFI